MVTSSFQKSFTDKDLSTEFWLFFSFCSLKDTEVTIGSTWSGQQIKDNNKTYPVKLLFKLIYFYMHSYTQYT